MLEIVLLGVMLRDCVAGSNVRNCVAGSSVSAVGVISAELL